ncbi:MAG TPA: glycosyltransferase [Acidisarcina sp.]
MKIVILGLTITSSWGNGHATTFRSLCRALHQRGHQIDFVEKDVEWYRSHRDLPAPEYCTVHLYSHWAAEIAASILKLAHHADVVVVGSYFPDAIAATRLILDDSSTPIFFYDIDTPVTLAALRKNGSTDYLDAEMISDYAAYLSFSGGPALREIEEVFHSPLAVALYCSVDPHLYRKTLVQSTYRCDLSYLGTYAADRQPKLMALLNSPAGRLPNQRFLVAGPMYPRETVWAGNVETINHVAPQDHPAFYSSSRFTLNLTRDEMVRLGYSPSVRLFEASACGAAILSDNWPGLESFLTPGEEVLIASSVDEVVAILRDMTDQERLTIGERAQDRILSCHTSHHRALEFEKVVERVYSTAGNHGYVDGVARAGYDSVRAFASSTSSTIDLTRKSGASVTSSS